MPAIVYSNLDSAGINIAENLRRLYGFKPSGDSGGKASFWRDPSGISLLEIDTPTITSDYIDGLVDTDLIVFASKHKSESGRPTLTAHPCGNWSSDVKPEYGGKPRTLAPTSALALKSAMMELAKSPVAGFDVVMECTHHGPLLKTPFIFVEIGSTEKEWARQDAGELVAKACYAACTHKPANQRIAIGIGGIHYSYEISKEMLRTDIAVGHICPKYMIEQLDEEMMGQMVEKSGGRVEVALVDWKSLKAPERERIIALLKVFNIPYVKV